ncbi:MAG TPA: aldehyde dehydrogenase family protein [Holophagaceae bacterium]|nr:aldehyde dehydrogenase family protein [Holophagaceae bacterium]
MTFKLTYATMFDPPAEMHDRFEAALVEVRSGLGTTHAQFIAGREVPAAKTAPKRSPIDAREILGHFPVGTAADVDRAVAAAKVAFPAWRATPRAERIRLMRKVAERLEARVYEIGAALSLEVGKNRMEGLGEAQETADFFWGYAEDFERCEGYDRALPDDPVAGFRSRNRSVLKPHGVWGVIAPFNFPLALMGGPVAAALVTGNTVVAKGASDTPWAGRLLADCLRDAGLPEGVFNLVNGPGGTLGEALVHHPDVAGLTFTGSAEVGMQLHGLLAGGRYPRPCIAEMGGKNACIVTAHGDLDRAELGIVRSAFGLSGQKCSALSRLYVHEAVADELIERLQARIATLGVGDPTRREHWMGPVITERALLKFERACEQAPLQGGRILAGGARLTEGDLVHGHFAAPTLAEGPAGHPLFIEELFLPFLMVNRVGSLEEALGHANASSLGLTAGVYGNDAEVATFLDRIEAGVTYANRPQGATTGAWPGYQAFGGWKGSGTTGKAIGSFYYLPQYLREQSQTVVE